MMITKISTIALCMIAVTVFIPTQGFSQSGNQDHIDKIKPMVGMPPYPHFEELNLSEEQVKKIKDVRYEFEKKRIEIDSKIDINELKLQKMMRDDASEKEINKQIDKITQQKGEKRKLHYRSQFEIKKSLSDEQWQSFKKNKRGMGHMNKMHDRGYMKHNYRGKKKNR